MAKRKPRGSSKAGRPRKVDAKRYPSGRLIAKDQVVEPNPFLLRQRATVMGDCASDPSVTENPMDLAHARGWLTQRQVEAGRRYAALYRSCHPTRPCSAPHEAPPAGEREDRAWSEIPRAEIVVLFDRMMDATTARSRPESLQAKAHSSYLALSAVMDRQAQIEVFNAFCLGMWPRWEVDAISDRDTSADAASRHAALVNGLDAINRLLTTGAKRATSRIVEMKTSVCCA